MCYRDTEFCPGNGCSKFKTCPRALTEEVIAGAERWWGGPDAPISVMEDPEKLPCWTADEHKTYEDQN